MGMKFSYRRIVYVAFIMSSVLLLVLAACLHGAGASISWGTLLAPFATFFSTTSSRQDDQIEKLVARLRAEKARHDPSQARLIFGYSACLDVAVKAKDFIPRVMEEFGIENPRPQFHSRLESAQDFVESFLLFFSQGANAEQRVRNPGIFKVLADIARGIDDHKKYAGGNALTMAQRAALEGAGHVLLGAQVTPEAQAELHGNVRVVGDISEIDIHLALEYGKDDVIAGIPSKRTNRFYLNSDFHNAALTARPSLEKAMKATNSGEGWIFTVSGLQLLDIADDEWREIVHDVTRAVRTYPEGSHFESGAFESSEVFHELWASGLPFYVRSLGVNEQELAQLDNRLRFDAPSDEASPSDSKPKLSDGITQLHRVFSGIRERPESRLSRIHFHTLHFHAMCYDPREWGDGGPSIAAAALAAAELSCGPALGNREWDAFDNVQYSAQELADALGMPRDEIRKDRVPCAPHPTDTGTICCASSAVVCSNPSRTAGLGDSISGAGLTFQEFLSPSESQNQELYKFTTQNLQITKTNAEHQKNKCLCNFCFFQGEYGDCY